MATYLVSGPGTLTHVRPQAPAVTRPAPRGATDVDIQDLADRLQSRVRGEVSYQAPTRNPFAFGVTRHAERKQVIAPKPPETPVAPAPQAPSIGLSGIASDRVNGSVQRTAIFSSPTGVLLAREGETVGGSYRVVSIDENAVTLETTSDGTTLRLSLSRP